MTRPAPLTLRLGDLEDDVLSRGDRAGLTIKRDLRRYYNLLATSIPALTPDQARAALRAMVGKPVDPAYLWAELTTAGEESLGTRVKDMSVLEQLALADALDRANHLVQQDISGDEVLRRVGLL